MSARDDLSNHCTYCDEARRMGVPELKGCTKHYPFPPGTDAESGGTLNRQVESNPDQTYTRCGVEIDYVSSAATGNVTSGRGPCNLQLPCPDHTKAARSRVERDPLVIGAQRLVDAVWKLVELHVIDARSPAADAALDLWDTLNACKRHSDRAR